MHLRKELIMVGKPIFPMAYKIKPNQVRKIYYLGFPSSWKEELIKLTKANNPKFKIEYGLPTHALHFILYVQKKMYSYRWQMDKLVMKHIKQYL